MSECQETAAAGINISNAVFTENASGSLYSLSDVEEIKPNTRIVPFSNVSEEKASEIFNPNKIAIKGAVPKYNNIKKTPEISQYEQGLFRLFLKKGEYVYARPYDIVMIESCDHLVKVYLAINDKIKKAVRNNTLKDFLLQLPQEQFTRIGRFCAINTARLSGGNCNEQTFEFDFRVSIKLRHSISQAAFNTIGK